MARTSLFVILSTLVLAQHSLASPPFLEKRATISTDGSCGGSKSYTCQGSNYGNSCSKNNQCGSSADFSYSKLSNGCQPAYGYCASKGSVSPDGSCGGTDAFKCPGSDFGDSCGRYNLCGQDAGYSGEGCQPQYGYCQKCTSTLLPSTVTSTKRTTTTIFDIPRTTKTVTLTSGIGTTNTTTTTTSINLSTFIVTTNTTTSAIQSTNPTVTVTTTVTVSNGTTTTTTTGGLTFIEKRGAPTIFTLTGSVPIPTGPPPPERTKLGSSDITLPKYFRRAPVDPAGLLCGTIISTGFATITKFTTTTITTRPTMTSTSTIYTTVPLNTTVVTSIIVATNSSVTLTTTTNITTLPLTTSTATITTTFYVTVPVSTAVVAQPNGVYKKVVENTQVTACTYSRYFARLAVSTNPANNYQVARNQCAAACSRDTRCVVFFFDRFDQDEGSYTECLLDSSPYDASQLGCRVTGTTLYYVAYDKQV